MSFSSHPQFLIWTVPWLVGVGCWGGIAGPPTLVSSAAEPSITYNLLELPSSRQAQAVVQTEARFFWEQRPLRDGLRELGERHGITIWLDRRIDPSTPITLATQATDKEVTLLARLSRVAAAVDADVGLVENVIYFGPRDVPPRAQRAAVELHDSISKAAESSDAQSRELAWGEATTPQQVLEQMQTTWNMRIDGELPHDLWHAGGVSQPATLATQLTLLLAGFDLEATAIGAQRFQLQPLGDNERWQAAYRAADLNLRGNSSDALGNVRVQRGMATVSGVTAFHLNLLAPRLRPAPRVELGGRKWQFQVENAPVEAILDKLATAIGFEVEWADDVSPEARLMLISFDVSDASLDELLAAIAKASGLVIARDGIRVSVTK